MVQHAVTVGVASHGGGNITASTASSGAQSHRQPPHQLNHRPAFAKIPTASLPTRSDLGHGTPQSDANSTGCPPQLAYQRRRISSKSSSTRSTSNGISSTSSTFSAGGCNWGLKGRLHPSHSYAVVDVGCRSRRSSSRQRSLRVFAAGSSRRARGWDDEAEGGGSFEMQRRLVELVRVQVNELAVSSVVEEEQRKLRSLVQDSDEKLDRIAIRAMRGADEFSNRVLRQLDASASAIERDLILARKEMEEKEKELSKLERRVYESRNDGLFFKSFSTTPPSRKSRGSRRNKNRFTTAAMAPTAPSFSGQPVDSQTNSPLGHQERSAHGAASGAAQAGINNSTAQTGSHRRGRERGRGPTKSVYKQILYTGLSLVMVSFLWSSTSAFLAGHLMRLPKLAAYGAVFAGLLLQIQFEAAIMGDLDETTAAADEDNEEEQQQDWED